LNRIANQNNEVRPTVYYQGGRESGPRYSKALCYNFVVRPMRIKYTSDENLTVHGTYVNNIQYIAIRYYLT